MLKKTHEPSSKKRRRQRNEIISLKRKRVYNKKELRQEQGPGNVRVHLGGAAPLNVLNLKTGEVQELASPPVQRPRELTWLDYCETDSHGFLRIAADHGFQEKETTVKGVNFVSEKQKLSIINLLAELPRDFIFFYKNKIKVGLGLVQWTLEEIGKLPFRIIFGILKFLEIYFVRPLIDLGGRILRFWGNFLKQIFINFYWIFKTGILAIIYFPGDVFKFLKPAPVNSWARSISAFLIVCLLVILPFGAYSYISQLKATQGRVLGVSVEAYEYLQAGQSATQGLDFRKANEDFKKAKENFLLAQKEIKDLNFMISGVLRVLPKGVAAQKILLAGQAMAEAGVYMTEGFDVLHTNDANKAVNYARRPAASLQAVGGPANMRMSGIDDIGDIDEDEQTFARLQEKSGGFNLDGGDKVRTLEEKFSQAYPRIALAGQMLEEIDIGLLAADNQKSFLAIKSKVLALEKVCEKLKAFSKIISEIMAIDGSRRFLVIFQNESEIRPTGGFMGSLALLDVREGKVEQMEIPGGGPYDFQGSLTKRVAPPRPLQLINNQWQFQDANWFSDFRESAKKIMWFYENSGGATTDGVIAITSGLIPALLELTGPIEMLDYDKVIDKDNFYLETQMAVEVEYDREENKPKKFIADLTSKLIDKIINLSGERLIDLLTVIDLGLAQKRVMFYFSKPEVEAEVLANNWGGEVQKTERGEDYLYVVNANIGGGKTDRAIEQKIVHETEVLEGGQLIDTVTIIRSHKGGPGDFFANQRNVDYLRVYVPEGSVLLEAKGFMPLAEEYFKDLAPGLLVDTDLAKTEGNVLREETSGTMITREFGKTVFGNWLILEPGETVICKLKYRLPWVVKRDKKEEEDIYTLLLQKQPGSGEDIFEKIIFLPEGFKVTWKYPEDEYAGQYSEAVKFRGGLAGDKYYGIIFR